MVNDDKRQRPLPLTETLVFDIVEYLLAHAGYGYSTEISSFMVSHKPRRYTSREVVGILRNRPMFRHAQSKDRKGGIRWRLDLLQLERYLAQKGFQERASDMGIYDKMRELKIISDHCYCDGFRNHGYYKCKRSLRGYRYTLWS